MRGPTIMRKLAGLSRRTCWQQQRQQHPGQQQQQLTQEWGGRPQSLGGLG